MNKKLKNELLSLIDIANYDLKNLNHDFWNKYSPGSEIPFAGKILNFINSQKLQAVKISTNFSCKNENILDISNYENDAYVETTNPLSTFLMKKNIHYKEKKALFGITEILNSVILQKNYEKLFISILDENYKNLTINLNLNPNYHVSIFPIKIFITKNLKINLQLNYPSNIQNLCSLILEIDLEENSYLNLTINQTNSSSKATLLSQLTINQKEKSVTKVHTYTKDSNALNKIDVNLLRQESNFQAYGLAYGKNENYIHNNVYVVHSSLNTSSNQFYKSLLTEKSNIDFWGEIKVKKGSKKTAAFQKNDALILSENANFNSKPILSIFEDEVKCTHGATIGKINNDHIFYLKSRGLNEEEIRKIMTDAFLNEVLTFNDYFKNINF